MCSQRGEKSGLWLNKAIVGTQIARYVDTAKIGIWLVKGMITKHRRKGIVLKKCQPCSKFFYLASLQRRHASLEIFVKNDVHHDVSHAIASLAVLKAGDTFAPFL